MFIAYCYKLKPNKSQAKQMTNWLFMLRANYNFNLRCRIEAYEQVRVPKLGGYCHLDNKGECCPLTCSVSKNATNGYPWKNNGKRRNAYQHLAKMDQKIVDQRQDYHWKIANKLCRDAEVLVFENLSIKALLKKCQPKKDEQGKYIKNGRNAKKALSRLINDAAWGELKLKVQSVAEKLGRHYVEVDPKNTSRECHKCGHTAKENRKKERFFCLECNHLEDSDIQASKSILAKGLKQLGINPNQLPMVHRKVTAQDISLGLPDEPSNPIKIKQLTLFDSGLWSVSSVMD